MRIPLVTMILVFICVFCIIPVYCDNNPVIGAYFYLFDDCYNLAMSQSDTIPWDQVNRLYIAFATVKDGELQNLEVEDATENADTRIRNVVSLCREKNPYTEIFISSNYGDAVTTEYLSAAEQPEHFAVSVRKYLQEYDLDGYDMDWESLDINDYTDQQIALLRACDTEFGTDGALSPRGKQYGLTCTIWPGVHNPDTVASYADYVDNVNLMTYGPGEGNNLSEYASLYAEAGVPYAKMIGGVESEFGYEENGGHDTRDSVEEKTETVRTLGLAGLMNWRMDNDMRTQDGITEEGPPTFQVTGWVFDELSSDSGISHADTDE